MADWTGEGWSVLVFKEGSQRGSGYVFAMWGPDTTPPIFGGITSLTSVGTTSMTAHWTAATDNRTAQGNIVYEVCWATTAAGCTGVNFTPMLVTDNVTYPPGSTSVVITGLNPLTTYYVCVQAMDQAFNLDGNSITQNATTT